MATNIWVELPVTSSGGGSGTVTSVGLADSTGLFNVSGSPVTTSGTLTLASLNTQAQNTFFAAPNGSSGAPTFRAIVAADIPTLNQNTTGTASNITASSNSTLTTLSALSLPTTQLSGVLAAANGGSPPVTRNLYVDNGRTDSFTPDGSITRPFSTVGAAISQIITNADNSTHIYNVNVNQGIYQETLSFNSTTLTFITFTALGSVSIDRPAGTFLTSTSNNTQLATLTFNGFIFNGAATLTGDTNGTNFGSAAIGFQNCQFNLPSGSGLAFNNVNNINFYYTAVQGSGSTSTFTNIAMVLMEGPEGFKSGTSLSFVQNNGTNQPSQSSGNYCLFSETKFNGTGSIDAGSELDLIQCYVASASAVTNNGTIHSFGSIWEGSLTLNNGSSTRIDGDIIRNLPTINAGATLTNRGWEYSQGLDLQQQSTPGSNPAGSHDKLYFKSDDKLYGLNSSGTEVLIGAQFQTAVSQTITAGQSITSSSTFNQIQAAGALSTSTTTVIVAGTANGQTLQVVNVGSNTITIKSGGNTDLPGLTDYALTASSSIAFVWSGSTWYTTSASIN